MICTYPSWGAIEACLAAPVFEYNGARKIVQRVLWEPRVLPTIDLELIGYARPLTKLKALQRMYYNPDEADRVRKMMKHREEQAFTAVAMSMRAGAKDRRSMGWCMESMVIGLTPDRTTVNLIYRSTEVIKKFTADLAFLPWVFNQLEIVPDDISFYFSNAYLSGVFFPALFRFLDPIEFLKMLRKREPKLFVVATRFLRRSVRNRGQHFPYSPERQQHEYAWKHYPEKMKSIGRYLETELTELDKRKRG